MVALSGGQNGIPHCCVQYLVLLLPDVGMMVKPGDLGSIPGRVIPKTQKMVLDATLLNTQNYKVRIKGMHTVCSAVSSYEC